MTAPWWYGGMATLDTETTGVDLENDRIVEICLGIIRPTAPAIEDRVRVRTTLINPGIPVPDEAARVHGYTTEVLEKDGSDPAAVLDVYAADIALALTAGLPLVAMNAVFDLTILDRDCLRHGLPTVTDRLDGRTLGPVIDPMVLDKELVKRRRRVSPTQGARQLKTLAQVWGVGWDDNMAHAAEYDAMQAARVVWQLCQRNPVIAALTPMELHTKQVGWAHAQAVELGEWFASKGETDRVVHTAWPIIPPPTALRDLQNQMAAAKRRSLQRGEEVPA